MVSYFWKIKSIVIILTSLNSHVNGEDVVHYALEEMRSKSKSLALPVDYSSSSHMVLMAQLGTFPRPSTPHVKLWRPCYNFAKGSCRFGNGCKFVHDHNAKNGDTSGSKLLSTNNTNELTRDLYPIMAPSPIPRDLLVSQHTWHHHLGHPGSDVLCRLVSNNVISCNKETPLVLCHACQLGNT
nr:ribonuclease H-like domain-containing protein [Tanacetum cinerariifolium]